MLTKKMESALNRQLELESYASYLYLSMASWFDQKGMEGSAKFMYRQSDEEHSHMMRIFNYILEMDGKAIVPAVSKPPHKYESATDIFKQVYEHECKVTAAINKLVNISIDENDHASHNFLQWYVEEQREEEALMRSILDKLNLIGDGPQSLYFIDKEVENINKQAEAQESNKSD